MTNTRTAKPRKQYTEAEKARFAKEREAKLNLAHNRLVSAVEQIVTSEDWLAWLKVSARFHKYSFNNVLLIACQRPDASDGWCYWPKPCRAAARLMDVIEGDRTWDARYGPRDDVTAADVRKAYVPIKAFLTRSGLTCEIVDPEFEETNCHDFGPPPGLFGGPAVVVLQGGPKAPREAIYAQHVARKERQS